MTGFPQGETGSLGEVNANALTLGSQLHEYSILKVLGAGGFGITYLAKDAHLEKNVVIKEYFPDMLAQRENKTTVIPRTIEHEKVDIQWGLD